MSSITSNIEQLNISELNPYEGKKSHLLAEDPDSLWKGIIFDPNTIAVATNVLTLVDNKIVMTDKGGGGGGTVDLTGFVTGTGPLGSPVLTSLSPTVDINTTVKV